MSIESNRDISRHWRLRKQRYLLQGEICPEGHVLFPPRDICPHCQEEAKKPYQLSGRGEIYSFTKVYSAPERFREQVPYYLALIRLEEGPLITAQLTDLPLSYEPQIGDPVEMVTRRLSQSGDERSMLIYGYKFRPPLQPEVSS